MSNALKINLTDKTIIIHKRYHAPDYQDLKFRIFHCEGGFGCNPETAGRAIFGFYLVDGEKARIEGFMVERLATEKDWDSVKMEIAEDWASKFLGVDR